MNRTTSSATGVVGVDRLVSPSWFRRFVLPFGHDSWDEAEADMLPDPDQRQRINELCADLSESGFEIPVCVGRDHWWSHRFRVIDGMHRSIAAMRLGLNIPLRFGDPERPGYELYDEYTVTLSGGSVEGPLDLSDRVLGLTSWRSGDGFWMTWGGASGAGSGMRVHLPRRPERRAQTAAELEARLRDAGIAAEVVFSAESEV